MEQNVEGLNRGMHDLNHNVTVLLGVVIEQGKDIREIEVRLADFSERLDTVDGRLNTMSGHLNTLDGRLTAFEQHTNNRFDAIDARYSSFLCLLDKPLPLRV